MSDESIKRVSILPNLITTFGLACGLFVVFKMAMLQPGTADFPVMQASALLLLLAAGADVLDGAVARMFRAESEFGVIFDSLANAITFGVAPAMMILKSLSLPPEHELALLASAAAMLYSVCGVLRLARYSSGKGEIQPPELEGESKRRRFKGLPIPAAAGAAVSALLFMISPEVEKLVTLSPETRAIVSICVLVLLGYFMVSRLSFPSVKTLQVKVQSMHLIIAAALFTILLFYAILNFFPLVYVAIAWGYVLTAWVFAVIRGIKGRRFSRE